MSPAPPSRPGPATPTPARRPGPRGARALRRALPAPPILLPALLAGALLAPATLPAQEEDPLARARERMVREDIVGRGAFGSSVGDRRVLDAMRTVPRHEFVPARYRAAAYADRPLPIGHGQTISQPYIVARMTQLLELEPGEKVLEVGTGSGYQAAVLAEITDSVFSIEIVGPLAREARERLRRLGYDRVTVRHGDGYGGWPERAPFDAIVVTAAPERIPEPLIEQLSPGGRMVVPRGPEGGIQILTLVRKTPDGEVVREELSPVRFVPLTRDTTDAPSGPR